MTYIELAIKIDEGTYNNFVRNGYSRADVIALHNALLNGTSLEQEPSRDMEEIREVMSCDADAETKCKMIYNILTAKPHYFEKQEPCEDAISRTDLIRKLQAWDAKATGIPNYALGIIKELPSVTPKEKVGHWNKYYTSQKGNDVFNCKECGRTFIVMQGQNNMKFCPNCGCRMVEPQEGSDKGCTKKK